MSADRFRGFSPATVRAMARGLYRKPRPPGAPGQEPLMYRPEIFRLLLQRFPELSTSRPRVLEIGPKDGLDSLRLQSLNPSELVFIDLPEKDHENQRWLPEIHVPHQYHVANFMYMGAEQLAELGQFDLVYCLGVLYHNAEQLRMFRGLYKLGRPGAVLAVESAVSRRWLLRFYQRPLVEIHYPATYRNTGTITHLPNGRAIARWMEMAGWRDVAAVPAYDRFNRNLIRQRAAFVGRRRGDADDGFVYYGKSGQNPEYRVGDAT
ncbi:MAG: methyltransferase domain-containing protein [Chloroflexota bacterium]